MRVALRAAILAIPILAAASCIRGTLPARELYRLRVPTMQGAVRPALIPATAPLPGSMAIVAFETPGLYGERSIVFRLGDNEYGLYPAREWALPLGDMLGMVTEEVLARQPITSDPARFDPPSRRSRTWLWRGSVREFEEVNRGREVLASVHLEASLVRTADDSVLWSGTSRQERVVPNPTMENIVRTLSDLAAEVLGELARDAAATVAGTSAATARTTP